MGPQIHFNAPLIIPPSHLIQLLLVLESFIGSIDASIKVSIETGIDVSIDAAQQIDMPN